MVRYKSNVAHIGDDDVACCMQKSLQGFTGNMVTDQDWSSHRVKCDRLKAKLSENESLCQNGSGGKKKGSKKEIDPARLSLKDLVEYARKRVPVKTIKSAILSAM